MRFALLLLILLSHFPVSIQAQTINSAILQKPWQASWICVPGESTTGYGVYLFRKSVELSAKPASFVVHVSADNRYKLFVNGKLISLGLARDDLTHWKFETVDLAPYLQAGKNTIAARVWAYSFCNGFTKKDDYDSIATYYSCCDGDPQLVSQIKIPNSCTNYQG